MKQLELNSILFGCRLQLIAAVEGDDWSAVIDGQTAQTVRPPVRDAAPEQISSPFSRVSVHRTIGERHMPDLT